MFGYTFFVLSTSDFPNHHKLKLILGSLNKNKVTKVEFENNELDYDTFIETAGFFNQSQPQSFIVPWGNQESLYLYGKYYLMQHFTKSKDWKLAKSSLCNWLFIDDGFGHIINPNGAVYRYDFLRSGFNVPMINLTKL